MHILLASLLLTTVTPASALPMSLVKTYIEGADDGYAYRIESGVYDYYPRYGRGPNGAIHVAAGFTIEEHEISGDELLPGSGEKTNNGKRPAKPGLTLENLDKMGPCCPSGPGWMPAVTFCQHSVWKDLNGNGKFELKEQIIELYETGQRNLQTGQCKVGPVLGSSGEGQQRNREQTQTGNRDQPRTNPPPTGNISSVGPPGTTFDCDIELQSMGVRVVNEQNKPRFAKIGHTQDGGAGFNCWYKISGVKSNALLSAHWIEAPYKRGRYTFGKLKCGKGLLNAIGEPNMPGASTAYFRGANGKAAYVSYWYLGGLQNINNFTRLGLNRFKAIAEKMLAQIEPRAVDCPR